jgi:hypothetical protein
MWYDAFEWLQSVFLKYAGLWKWGLLCGVGRTSSKLDVVNALFRGDQARVERQGQPA